MSHVANAPERSEVGTQVDKAAKLGQEPTAPWGAWGARPPNVMTKGRARRRKATSTRKETP